MILPSLFAKCYQEILATMAHGNTVKEVTALMPQIENIFRKYVHLLKRGKVPLSELVFTKQTSGKNQTII